MLFGNLQEPYILQFFEVRKELNQNVHHVLCGLIIMVFYMLALFSNAILHLDPWFLCSIVPVSDFKILFGSCLMLG